MYVTPLTWTAVQNAAAGLAGRWRGPATLGEITAVYGVPRGGTVPAALVAGHLNLTMVDEPGARHVLVVDDLVDSGVTAARYPQARFDALFRKPHSPAGIAEGAPTLDGWLVFPWEADTEATGPADAVVRLLEHIGEDPHRPGLVDTPARVLKALTEMTSGYAMDPAEVLARQFPDDYDEMVVLRNIDFHSMCEHHLLGFSGTATVAYVPTPGRGVVGLSKLARLVDLYARRLQVQERLTQQIADAIADNLEPLGVGVLVQARHSCMGCRGVRKGGAEMVTSSLRGVLRDEPAARAEFMALAHGGSANVR